MKHRERNAKILKLFRDGLGSAEIADSMNLSQGIVQKVIQRNVEAGERRDIRKRGRIAPERTTPNRSITNSERRLDAVLLDGRNLMNAP